MRTEIYANYGMIAHEGKPKYNQYKLSDIADKITIDLPDDLNPTENEVGDILIKLSDTVYLLNDVLEAGAEDKPILRWFDGFKFHARRLTD